MQSVNMRAMLCAKTSSANMLHHVSADQIWHQHQMVRHVTCAAINAC